MRSSDGSELTVRFMPEARQDVRVARAWFTDIHPSLADRFGRDLDRTVGFVADNPEMYAQVYRGLRRAVLKRFDYAVVYRLLRDEIVVLGVLHCKLDPRTTQARMVNAAAYP